MIDNNDPMSVQYSYDDDDTTDNTDTNIDILLQHQHLLPILTRSSPYTPDTFVSNQTTYIDLIELPRILVVGAGGLGCEILKNLVYSGFNDIHIIDMDTIDISNLNRQFLFRQHDVGKYKADIAAKYINNKVQNINIKSHTCAIQDKPIQWYKQFTCIIAGLDNIEARRWLNETIVNLVEFDDITHDIIEDSIIPIIDGGTEKFDGQTRVFLPYKTSCYECNLQSLTPQITYPMCTIRNVPRLPEHCIQYALKIEWPLLTSFDSVDKYTMKNRNNDINDDNNIDDNNTDTDVTTTGVTLDKDNVEHMTWLYNRAKLRADKYNIQGVTFNLTMQVVKNIIPAIASTNALIAASCVNEVFKYTTKCSYMLNNYYMYFGASAVQGIHTETLEYAKNDNCNVCHKPIFIKLHHHATLNDLINAITKISQLNNVSITYNGIALYMSNLKSMYENNLNKTIQEYNINNKSRIIAIDSNGNIQKCIIILQP